MREWQGYVRERLNLLDVGGAAESEIVEEVASQLEDCYLDARSQGASEASAVARAEALVTDWETLARDIRQARSGTSGAAGTRRAEAAEISLRKRGRGWTPLADVFQELRFAARRLRRTPAFTAVVLLTLGVGIGANTAIFSVVNGILLEPLPFDEPDRLISVWNTAPGMGEDILPQSPALHFTYEEEAQVLEDIGMWTAGNATLLAMDEPLLVPAAWLTSGTVRALRVEPVIGRGLTAEDDVPGAPWTAVVSHGYWQTRYGADPGVVGQTLEVNGTTVEIVGVMPPELRLSSNDPALFMPLRFDRSGLFVGNFTYRSIARLKEGVTLEQATADFARVVPLAFERFPGGMTLEVMRDARGAPLLRALREDVVGDVGSVLWVLAGGVGIILLIACANVANLFLVRAESRDRELAVRTALGAGHGRVVGQFVAESTLLGLFGGALGVGLAAVGLWVLTTTAPADLPRLDDIGLDGAVLAFTLLVSVLSSLLFGLFPVVRYGRIDQVTALKEGGRGAGTGKARHRVRNGLVVAQIAMALVLLVGSGLMIRSFLALVDVDPGFRGPDEVLVFGLHVPSSQVADPAEVAVTHETIVRRIAEVPGVTAAAISSSVTMDGGGGFDPIWVEDFPVAEGDLPPIRRFKWIGAGYTEAMQNPLVAGRTISWADVHDRARVVMVTETFAREYWNNAGAAVGKRIGTGGAPGDWREIVGVVGDVRDDGMSQPATAVVYWPMVLEGFWADFPGDRSLFVPRHFEYVVRSGRTGTPGFLDDVREAVWSVNGTLPLAGVGTLGDLLRGSMARTAFTLVMLAIAAAVALLLGAVGVYGVISYVVSQRTREIGVRIVLGAEAAAVKRMVLRQGMVLTALGVALGIAAAVGLTRWMSGVLYGVSPTDPLTFGTVAVVLGVVALLASYQPARRAASVDPMEAIRTD